MSNLVLYFTLLQKGPKYNILQNKIITDYNVFNVINSLTLYQDHLTIFNESKRFEY